MTITDDVELESLWKPRLPPEEKKKAQNWTQPWIRMTPVLYSSVAMNHHNRHVPSSFTQQNLGRSEHKLINKRLLPMVPRIF